MKASTLIIYPFRKTAFWTRYIYRRFRARPLIVSLLNREGAMLYKKNPPILSETERAIVRTLRQDGIAISSLEELFPKENLLERLQIIVKEKEDRSTMGRKKQFLDYIWGDKDVSVDLSSPFFQIALHPTILGVANEYLGMFSKFVFSSLNIANPVEEGEETKGSQRWHRDPSSGDMRICKMFIYLNDVDEDTGPFQYVKGVHRSGPLSRLFPSYAYDGYYPPEGAVERVVPRENIFSATGKAGSVIFCDTTGLHRGGYSKKKLRIMSTFLYVTPGSVQKHKFIYLPNFHEQIKELPPESKFALKNNF